MFKNLKVILVLGIVAIFFIVVVQIMGVQIRALYTQYPAHNSYPENKSALKNTDFGQEEFRVTLPEGWESDGKRAWNPKDKYQFITGGKVEVANNNTKTKSLISEGKIREFEMDLMASMCRDTDACGKISDFKMVKLPEGVQTFEFFVTYSGTSIDVPQGFRTEIHRSILVDGKLYRFWTSTTESSGKNSDTISNFRTIMDTFEVKMNQ